MKIDLSNIETSSKFYDKRYSDGYMDDWPEDKKQRVFEIICKLDLPAQGDALDFGCGNGVFTQVIKQALPKWKVYGCDISAVAIGKARQRFVDCNFFVADDDLYKEKKFDFLLTHHVLEHVYNIEAIARLISDMVSEKGTMLHILPCGNKGSLEHNICKMHKIGIDSKLGNRFFFEDEGHIRRLTTEQLSKLIAGYGFRLHEEFYSNQYYGAIKWIIEYDKKFIEYIADPVNSGSIMGYIKLLFLRKKLLLIKKAQNICSSQASLNIKGSGLFKEIKNIYASCVRRTYSLINYYYVNQAKKEWKYKNKNMNGSEMYLFFKRS